MIPLVETARGETQRRPLRTESKKMSLATALTTGAPVVLGRGATGGTGLAMGKAAHGVEIQSTHPQAPLRPKPI